MNANAESILELSPFTLNRRRLRNPQPRTT